MERKHIDIPDERAFLDEVLRSVQSAPNEEAKVRVLAKAFFAFRGWCYAASALMVDDAAPTKDGAVIDLFTAAAMYYPEGYWRRFGELLYPKEGPMLARMIEAAKKRKEPR